MGGANKITPSRSSDPNTNTDTTDIGIIPGNGEDVKPITFIVHVDNNDGAVGLVLRKKKDKMAVRNVKDDGRIAQWNKENTSCPVKVGDILVSANDSNGDSVQMMAECKRIGPLKLVFERNVPFNVVLEKNGMVLGLSLKRSTVSDELTVVAIGEGRCREWNESHTDEQVKVGDTIVAVNGFQETPHIIKLITQRDRVELMLLHSEFLSC